MNKAAPATTAPNRQPARSNNSNINQPTQPERQPQEPAPTAKDQAAATATSSPNQPQLQHQEKQPQSPTGMDQAATTATSCPPTPAPSFHADPSDHFEAMVASLEDLIWGMPRAWKCPGWSLQYLMCCNASREP